MARAGLYKSDVKRARDALAARGRRPSLDAVRIELGNTGSRTTIHKYLRELETEEGGLTRGVSVSDELLSMVTRLSERLHEEADDRIQLMQAECTARSQKEVETARALQVELAASQVREHDLAVQLEAARSMNERMKEQLQAESIARHTAEQHATDIKQRLDDSGAHVKSLEEKHTHVRNSLEHFRQAYKEQRDQELRRHEHQLQQLQVELRQLQQQLSVKQEEVTRLNQDGARLVNDLLHARQALSDLRQVTDRQEVEWGRQMGQVQQQATTATQRLQQQLTETRLELAGQTRETSVLQKQLVRLQGLHDQLVEEKITWRHERAQMEEMLRPKQQEMLPGADQ